MKTVALILSFALPFFSSFAFAEVSTAATATDVAPTVAQAPSPASAPSPDPASSPTPAKSSAKVYDLILSQGVPKASLDRIIKFVKENKDREVNVDAYTCAGQDPLNLKPCDQRQRSHITKAVKIETRDYAAVVDMSLPSLTPRFFVINVRTGQVEKYLTTHGKGSGKGLIAYKFGNHQDSNMTSLGLYQTGDTYHSDTHGTVLRLYGLEKSNDHAYERDVVVHGADYADAKFAQRKNPSTGKPYDRLGLSWGCPALSYSIVKDVIAKLQAGTILDIYQKDLMEAARSNSEVSIPPPPGEAVTEKASSKNSGDSEEE